MDWRHFLSDVTLGQVFSFLTTIGTLAVLWLSGRAAANARQGVRLVKRLIASVGLLPEDGEHRQGQTLTAQFSNLAEQVEQLRRTATEHAQENHDESPIRPSRAHTPEARRHRL